MTAAEPDLTDDERNIDQPYVARPNPENDAPDLTPVEETAMERWRAMRAKAFAESEVATEERVKARRAADGAPKADNDNEPGGKPQPDTDSLPEINPADWHGKPVPAREWFIDGLIPARTVTMLSGDGGVGKSLLIAQIGAAAAMGVDTLGLSPKPCRVTYLGAEDDADEFHRRLADIAAAHGKTLADLANLRIIPMADRDALLSAPDQSGIMKPTKVWHALLARLGRHKPGLIILDTSADLYGGDEIKRGQVRAFVSMLRALAIASSSAVVLLSHPSVAGMQTGTGSSGSTAWNNSVRSRLYLTKPTGADTHPDLRILSLMKANYGGTGDGIRLRWSEGAFIEDDGQANEQLKIVTTRHDAMFLKLLSAINRTGRRVAQTKGVNYAPKILVDEPDALLVTVSDLEKAMARLLKAGTIKTIEEGPRSRSRQRLIVSAEDFSPTGRGAA
jgi:RecA-family ATPase